MADQETLDAIAVMLDGLETRLYQKLDEKLEEKLEDCLLYTSRCV